MIFLMHNNILKLLLDYLKFKQKVTNCYYMFMKVTKLLWKISKFP